MMNLLTKTTKAMSRRNIASFQQLNMNFQTSTKKEREQAATTKSPSPTIAKESTTSPMLNRFIATAEITVSKIFPAGFGWQTGSVLAAGAGFEGDSAVLAVSTGVGDAVGVFVGHSAYYALKKSAGWEVNMSETTQTGLLLGSAAFCSGTVWQPSVNLFQGMDLPFIVVMGGVWANCTLAFFGGLRGGRALLSNMEYIKPADSTNTSADLQLSLSIGGATGFFVGTDAVYLPSENFLLPVVGITEGTGDLVGCALAGTSTAMGYAFAQSAQNVVLPLGKTYLD